MIKLVPLGEGVSEFLDGIMAKSTGNNNNNMGKDKKVKSTESANNIMDQPPKLKREYQPDRRGNKGWSEEDMLNDLDATMEDQGDEANKEDDDDGMSIDYTDNADNGKGYNDAINDMLEEKLSSYSLDCYPYTFSPLLLFTNKKYFDRGYSNYNAVAAFFAPALADLGVNKVDDVINDNDAMNEDRAAASLSSPVRNRSNQDKSPTRSPPRKSPRNGGGSDNDDDTYENGINMLHGVIYDRKNMTYDEVFNHIVATQSLVICCIDAHFTAFQILNSQCLIYYDPLSPNIRVASGESSVQDAALFLLMKCKYGDDVHVQENKNYYTGSSASPLQRRM